MLEYKFSTSQHSQNLFKNNIVPRLAYVQDINEYHQNLSIKHSHSQFLEIIHIIKGCVIYEINQKHYRLTPGDTLVINPQQIHRISESFTNSRASTKLFNSPNRIPHNFYKLTI